MSGLKTIYIANIVVAGWIAISAMFFPKTAAATVFSNAYPQTEVIRLVGCLWLTIAALSALGLWKPLTFSPILLVQLIYKSAWLLVVALPALLNKQSFPKEMALFFVVWVLVLPFVIPWGKWI